MKRAAVPGWCVMSVLKCEPGPIAERAWNGLDRSRPSPGKFQPSVRDVAPHVMPPPPMRHFERALPITLTHGSEAGCIAIKVLHLQLSRAIQLSLLTSLHQSLRLPFPALTRSIHDCIRTIASPLR